MNFPLRHPAVAAASVLALFATALVWAAGPTPAPAPPAADSDQPVETVAIPGPLRSFLRMTGISQEIALDEVLPALARNVFLHGYENGRETEYLVLVDRYLNLARNIEKFAGADGVIRISDCSQAQRLVDALGYRFQDGCSHGNATLITANAERAFLTIDSGFPITRLEEALSKGDPFSYPFPSTRVPVIFRQSDWMALTEIRERPGEDLVDILIRDPKVGRLYSAIAHVEPHTRGVLVGTPGLRRLLPLADSFDFYGSQICVPDNQVIVPGGEDAEKQWAVLAGASPHDVSDFVAHLMGRDRNWLAAYFDALSRLSPEQQSHIQGARLRTLYDAYRSTGIGIYASSGVFPRNTELMLLLSRMHWQSNGEPDVPGGVSVWKEAFRKESHSFGNHAWMRHARGMNTPEEFLETLVAATNIVTEIGPVQDYMAVAAIQNSRPSQPLSPATVQLLADRFSDYSNWYRIFTDFPELDETSIALFFKTADSVSTINVPGLRANALGALQADLGIWQILASQREIPATALNASWQQALQPFNGVSTSNRLFDAARTSLNSIVTAAGGSNNPNEDEIVDLLAGPRQNTPDGARVHDALAARMHAVLDDQRLVSLETLYQLFDGLGSMAKGAALGASLVPLAENLHEFEMPRPIFSGGERTAWAPLIYADRHAELQVRTDLTKVLRTAHSPAEFESAQSRLSPFLRDTLVGLNYAYYEPPGAQVLHNNPLFVRSHDFSVSSVQGVEHVWGSPELIGIGVTAGGGAYLMGSLAGLPYALANAEEDFIAPEKVQALIWREAVPQLLVSAVIPRWWNISAHEMHAAALYQRAGEELINAAETDPAMRAKVTAIFSERFPPGRMEAIEEALAAPGTHEALLSRILPSDKFYLEARFRAHYPGIAAQWGAASKELDSLIHSDPDATSPNRLSQDFGVPHPTFTESDTCSLLDREPFPVAGGNTSRLFGESWESSNLYWARIADERGYSPVMLNVLVPELTRNMVSNIFATYIDDWPALLRAMRQTGDDFLQGKLPVPATSLATDGQVGINGSASE
jgi:hypothetical protein